MNKNISVEPDNSSRYKVLIFLGTRPETIKMIPLYQELKDNFSDRVDAKIICSGQHKEMIHPILAFFEVSFDDELNIMTHDQSLADLTAAAIKAIDLVLQEEKPDIILIQGDTTTAFCAALAAFYRQIRVAHVEAGLRTYDIRLPFPEEVNRQFISKVADLHFAATKSNEHNLLHEGVSNDLITVVGNTVIDTLILCLNKLDSSPALRADVLREIARSGYTLSSKPYVLITGHRRESFGDGFQHICRALSQLANDFQDLDWVYPVHLNPNVKEVVHQELGDIPNVILLPPLNYSAFVLLMQGAKFILTDSGGIQEEATFLKKPVFVMRDKTERQEGVELNLIRIVGTLDCEIIGKVSDSIANSFKDFDLEAPCPYGTGEASEKICQRVLSFLDT